MSTIRVGNIGPLTGNTSTVADPGVSGGGVSLVSQTIAASASSSIAFTNIPSWTRRITIGFYALTYASAEYTRIRLGAGGSLQSSSYYYVAGYSGAGGTSSTSTTSGSGFDFYGENYTVGKYGTIVLLLASPSTYAWTMQGTIVPPTNAYLFYCNGGVTLSGPITNISILGASGGNMNSGSVTCFYE